MKKIGFGFALCLWVGSAFADVAIFAGGCFWCTQTDFDKVPGVKATQVGYDGGVIKNPTYPVVSSGRTQYVESVRVQFDSSVVTYQQLVNHFLHTVDVTQANGQFCDIGAQYRSVIFYLTPEQQKIAEQVVSLLSKQVPNIQTDILPSTHFYRGEDYHQKYGVKNPVRYQYYRWRCGRDKRLQELWGKKINE